MQCIHGSDVTALGSQETAPHQADLRIGTGMTKTTEDGTDPIAGAHRSRRSSASIVALLCATGFLVSARFLAPTPLLSILVWPLLTVWWWRGFRSSESWTVADMRMALAIQIGFVLTLLSLFYVVPSEVPYDLRVHYDPYPVTAYAGFPWTGVEGDPGGRSSSQVPFDMGIDALLVNFAFWSAVAFLLMRLASRSALSVLIVLVGLATPDAVYAGVVQLGILFD